mgnify:CR=1 FL=1
MIVLADFAATFQTVVGVILSLSGLGVLLMGVIAIADKSWRQGTVTSILGAALLDIVDNLLVLLNAPETLFRGFLGAIIIVAVILNTFVGRQSRR